MNDIFSPKEIEQPVAEGMVSTGNYRFDWKHVGGRGQTLYLEPVTPDGVIDRRSGRPVYRYNGNDTFVRLD